MNTLPMQKTQQGFTLIELMIVVAIIGILASIAIPAYSNYIVKSQAAEAITILDNLKPDIASTLSIDPASVSCGANTVPVVVNYGVLAPPVVVAGVCAATFTFGANASAKITGQTVKMTFDAGTGAFDISQANTGGTIDPIYTPSSWE